MLNLDPIKIPGGAKCLASPKQETDREFVLEQIRMSMRLYGTKEMGGPQATRFSATHSSGENCENSRNAARGQNAEQMTERSSAPCHRGTR